MARYQYRYYFGLPVQRLFWQISPKNVKFTSIEITNLSFCRESYFPEDIPALQTFLPPLVFHSLNFLSICKEKKIFPIETGFRHWLVTYTRHNFLSARIMTLFFCSRYFFLSLYLRVSFLFFFFFFNIYQIRIY